MRTRFQAVTVIAAVLFAGVARAAEPEAILDRTVLPVPPVTYTNPIGVSYRDSVPQVRAPVAAPTGAPNILVILLDDVGYGQAGTFGGLISTPTLDRLAAGGLRYTRFHVTALCSPSRAALLTGRNHHSVGMGSLPDYGSGYPGYDGNLPRSAALVSEILRENGYATAAFGKWHLLPVWELNPSGPFDHWPTMKGFDYYYGFPTGATDQWAPTLFEGTQRVFMHAPPGRQADYTLNEDLANKAIAWIRREQSATPSRPFFAYYAPGAMHVPIQAPKAWIDTYKGKFDMGWDRYREIVFERQKSLGVIPPDTQLTPRPAELPAWDTLSSDQKRIAARQMEVYAGFMAQTDHEIGRIIDAISEVGQLQNTLILYIVGDNGASMENRLEGIFNIGTFINHMEEDPADVLGRLDELGSATSSPGCPAGWGWAGNTPFQWGKQIGSHLGGTRNPLVAHWPVGIKDRGGIRSQFHHLIDIVPTILEAADLPLPASVNGVRQKPVDGISMLYSFESAVSAGRRSTQYFENFANRAIYHDGWIAAASSGRLPWIQTGDPDFEKQPWELYWIDQDYAARNNLAAEYPEKLKELQDLFVAEARRHNVFPLDPRWAQRISSVQLRPSLDQGRTVFTYYGSPHHQYYSFAPRVLNRSHTISAEIIIPQSGGDGVIVSTGGRLGGYSLVVLNGRAHYTYNYVGLEKTTLTSPDQLPAGAVTVDFRFSYNGGGLGMGGTATLAINGKTVAEKKIARTMPISYAYQGAFDIGEDGGSPVGDYVSPFRFQGEIRKITFNTSPGDLTLSAQAHMQNGELRAAQINE
jgi:arylsulfatase